MATRHEIVETFYQELLAATNGLVDPNDIGLIGADDPENTPSIVYDKDFRIIDYNGASNSPDAIQYDSSGNVTSEDFHEFNEAQFFINLRASSQGELAPVYEAVHTHFQKWKFDRLAKVETFHPDAEEVHIREINAADDQSGESTFRGDVLELLVVFKRVYNKEGDVITKVEQDIDNQIFITD